MFTSTATLVIDIGNSETRVSVRCGKDAKTGKAISAMTTISNRFAPVSPDYIPSEDYSPTTSTILKVSAVVNGEPLEGTFANGDVQEREFNVSPLRPSAVEKKYNSQITALSISRAFLDAYREISKATGVASLDDLDITWNVVVLLPPGDVEQGNKPIVDIVTSIKALECTYPKVSIPLKYNKVSVLQEGFCAFVGTVFEDSTKIRKDKAGLLKETILIVDIGAGTTDFLIVKDNKVISNSRYTTNKGGNNVMSKVKKTLKQANISLTDSEIAESMLTGRVRDGSKEKDITKLINAARNGLATALVQECKDYLEDTEYPINSISKVLICGGGSMSTNGMIATSDLLVKLLKNLSPNMERVELPDETINHVNANGVYEKETQTVSPRSLNIIGASILADMVK